MSPRSARLTGVVKSLDYAVFACLLATFALAPHSIKGAARVCTAGTILFGISLLSGRRDFRWHPLYRPVLLFLLLVSISITFSSAPDWSWRRLGWYSLMLAVIVAGQTLRTRRRIASLILVLLLSASAILVRVGWQYTFGIGVKLVGLPAGNVLTSQLLPGDVIQTLNGRPTRSPKQFMAAVKATASDKNVVLRIARGAPIERVMPQISRQEFDAAVRAPTTKVERGHPIRAQAGFYHYIPFAGFMCAVALVAWGLVLSMRSIVARMAFGLVFLAASAAVEATLTRMYLVALIAGLAAALWMVTGRRARTAALLACALVLSALTFVIRDKRGVGWISAQDAGTQYRVEMWRDGLKLIRAHPLLGIGLDATMSGKWDVAAYREFPLKSHFHSSPIQVAVDAGLLALGAWMWIAVSVFALALRLLSRLPRDEQWLRGVALGVFGTAIAFYIAAIVHYNQGDGEVMILMSILMGIGVAADQISIRSATPLSVRKPSPVTAFEPPTAKAV